MNPQYRKRELVHQLEDTEASVVLTHAMLLEHIRPALEEIDRDPLVVAVASTDEDVELFSEFRAEPLIREQDDEDIALLPYTSGTTGKPKCVESTHGNFRAQMFQTLAGANSIPDESAKSLVWLPLYHITGFTHTAWQPLLRGGAVYLRSAANWDGEAGMVLIEEEGITHFVGVTAMYVDMVERNDFEEFDLTSLKMAVEGGAKLPETVQEKFQTTTGVEMDEGYGLTETHGATHTQVDSTYGTKHGSVGQPTRLTDCKIVDDSGEEVGPGEEGELLVRGPQVMRGYHGMGEATDRAFTEQGYFRTGDVARRDEQNYYEIVDRKKHVINTAGYNVYPSEIEELLAEHDAISEGAVVGIPDERRNEVPKAFVVPSEGVDHGVDVTPEEIQEFVLEQIAAYKHSREVEFVDDLPRTASGKIQKYELREK